MNRFHLLFSGRHLRSCDLPEERDHGDPDADENPVFEADEKTAEESPHPRQHVDEQVMEEKSGRRGWQMTEEDHLPKLD